MAGIYPDLPTTLGCLESFLAKRDENGASDPPVAAEVLDLLDRIRLKFADAEALARDIAAARQNPNPMPFRLRQLLGWSAHHLADDSEAKELAVLRSKLDRIADILGGEDNESPGADEG